jgi:hypothetical protein
MKKLIIIMAAAFILFGCSIYDNEHDKIMEESVKLANAAMKRGAYIGAECAMVAMVVGKDNDATEYLENCINLGLKANKITLTKRDDM